MATPFPIPIPKRVLVIAGDPGLRAGLRDVLELDGDRIAEAGTAAEALDRDDWSTYAAIILGGDPPDGSAADLLPRLRLAAPNAPVMIVNGPDALRRALTALHPGAAGAVVKPRDPDAPGGSPTLAMERSEVAFRHLVETAECLILILRPDHSILYLSPFVERLTGHSAAALLGRDYFSVFLPEGVRRAVAEEIDRVLGGHPTRGYQNPILCRDGSRRWVVWNARLIPDHDGGPAILAVGQDITGLNQAQERALQAERLAAIGQMVTGLAHESRNALQRGQACLEMLALRVREQPEALDLIGRIQNAQEHLHHLFEDVRGYAAPIRIERRVCDLAEVWREAWAHLESHRAGRRVALAEVIECPECRCFGDPFRLEQVFRNILENALAACADPVEIRVHCAADQIDGLPAIRVGVSDNGPGLEPEGREQLFEPFYTTKTKGTGLGMPIARRIIEAHGGRIDVGVGTGADRGAEIVISLPRGEIGVQAFPRTGSLNCEPPGE